MPFEIQPRIVVDLGANIGLTSVWLNNTYGCERMVLVEADSANVQVAQRNVELNETPAQIIHAAVGSKDGTALFKRSAASNVGCVVNDDSCIANTEHISVPALCMETILETYIPDGDVDLLKK